MQSIQGEYEGLLDGSVLSSLLRAGLPLLLRYALDSTTDAMIAAAIHCIHTMLVSAPMEVGQTLPWTAGRIIVLTVCMVSTTVSP